MTSKAVSDPHPKSAEIAALGASDLCALFERGDLTSTEVVTTLIARIEAIDGGATGLHAVIELAPNATEVAASLDAERRAGRTRGPLHGVPVLVKDNIDTAAPLHTSAGSLIFGDSSPAADAPLVRALRDAGAVVIGKANLSEWANFRGHLSSSGWSARGGQTRNPHALDRSPGGSSSGSGAAVAARLVPLAVGTETDGSILCPASACGVAGLKPTLGLVSRTGIVPISDTQDTAGPIARTAQDLGLLLEVLAGAVDDGEDAMATRARRPAGYHLSPLSPLPPLADRPADLSGLRVGVVRAEGYAGYHAPTDKVFDATLGVFTDAGAHLVDPVEGLPKPSSWEKDELTVLVHEFRAGLEAYFRRRAETALDGLNIPRTIADVIAHAEKEPRERLDRFGVDLFTAAAATEGLDSATYRDALATLEHIARDDGLDKVFGQDIDLLALPAMSPAWPIDHVLGDQVPGAGWSLAAVAGYPSATLPIGAIDGLPVGIALIGPPWSEGVLLRVLQAIETALGPSVTAPVPAFATGVPIGA